MFKYMQPMFALGVVVAISGLALIASGATAQSTDRQSTGPDSTGSQTARSTSAAATMVLIDGSGSMGARFDADKRTKFDAVRERLLTVVQAAGENIRGGPIGVTAFGHRRRGDCSDVQVIVGLTEAPQPSQALGTTSASAANASVTDPSATEPSLPGIIATNGSRHGAALDAIAKLNPRGKGPLASGLTAAFGAIGARRPASIIAFSDGPDNCQQDACAAAADLAKNFPGVAVHMIGLNLDATQQPRLQCVATATGGTFSLVRDSAELDAALDKVADLAMLSPRATPDAQSRPSADSSPLLGGATFSAKLALNDGSKTLARSARWRIFAAGSATPISESDGNDVLAKLEPGRYDVEARIDQAVVRETVTIAAGAATVATLSLNAAHLKVTVRTTNGREAVSSSMITIVPTDGGTAGNAGTFINAAAAPGANRAIIAHRGTIDMILPVGTYSVTATDGLIEKAETVVLAAGDQKSLDIVTQSGILELTTATSDTAPPLQNVLYVVEVDDPETASGRREVARSRAVPARFTVAAGTYYISAKSELAELRQRIAVGAGETARQRLILPLVPVSITAQIAGQIAGKAATVDQGLVFRITELDGEKREILRSLKPELNVRLAPGRYRIAAHLDAHRIMSAQDITIVAGTPASIVIDVEAAAITLRANTGRAGNTNWEIRDATDQAIWHSAAKEPKLLLSPGRYTVHFDQHDGRQSAAFDVHSGEQRVIELGPPRVP